MSRLARAAEGGGMVPKWRFARYTRLAMSVDGALNVTGISLEILGVATGFFGGPAGNWLLPRLSRLGERLQPLQEYGVITRVIIQTILIPLKRRIPDSEREVANLGVFLGFAGGIFGVGLILQLIAAATP